MTVALPLLKSSAPICHCELAVIEVEIYIQVPWELVTYSGSINDYSSVPVITSNVCLSLPFDEQLSYG